MILQTQGASILSSGCAFLKCLFRAWVSAGVVIPLVAMNALSFIQQQCSCAPQCLLGV